MKKIEYLFLLCLIIFAPVSTYASIIFDRVSPLQLPNVEELLGYDCDTGNKVNVYNPDETSLLNLAPCGAYNYIGIGWNIGSDLSVPGVYTWTECDDTIPGADCGWGSLVDMEADVGFISSTTFEFLPGVTPLATEEGSGTNGDIVFGIAILIMLNSLALVGFIWNRGTMKKHIWQK